MQPLACGGGIDGYRPFAATTRPSLGSRTGRVCLIGGFGGRNDLAERLKIILQDA